MSCFASFKKRKFIFGWCFLQLQPFEDIHQSERYKELFSSIMHVHAFMVESTSNWVCYSALWLPVSLVLQSESGVPVGFMLGWSWLKSLPLHLIQQRSLTFLFTWLHKVLMTPSLAHKNKTKQNPKQQQQQKRSNGKTAKTMKTFSYVITHTYKLQNQQSCYHNGKRGK